MPELQAEQSDAEEEPQLVAQQMPQLEAPVQDQNGAEPPPNLEQEVNYHLEPELNFLNQKSNLEGNRRPRSAAAAATPPKKRHDHWACRARRARPPPAEPRPSAELEQKTFCDHSFFIYIKSPFCDLLLW